ncbi:hypothetical protein PR048_030010 [Dryococelus australis]|uniref:Uncharacterized protein n=1 Tax=Dryococelus australis TaxID=614101 RepID=A0ABQ9GAH4_9NEOP|nr:hypothetical protein PR048_030010 [Dryococelus australis]
MTHSGNIGLRRSSAAFSNQAQRTRRGHLERASRLIVTSFYSNHVAYNGERKTYFKSQAHTEADWATARQSWVCYNFARVTLSAAVRRFLSPPRGPYLEWQRWQRALAQLAFYSTRQSFCFLSLPIEGATVAERLARSPPTKANRVQSPAGSPDSRKWESSRTMPLVGGFSRRSPPSPTRHSGAAPYSLQPPSSALKTSLLRAAQIGRWHQLATSEESKCRRDRCNGNLDISGGFLLVRAECWEEFYLPVLRKPDGGGFSSYRGKRGRTSVLRGAPYSWRIASVLPEPRSSPTFAGRGHASSTWKPLQTDFPRRREKAATRIVDTHAFSGRRALQDAIETPRSLRGKHVARFRRREVRGRSREFNLRSTRAEITPPPPPYPFFFRQAFTFQSGNQRGVLATGGDCSSRMFGEGGGRGGSALLDVDEGRRLVSSRPVTRKAPVQRRVLSSGTPSTLARRRCACWVNAGVPFNWSLRRLSRRIIPALAGPTYPRGERVCHDTRASSDLSTQLRTTVGRLALPDLTLSPAHDTSEDWADDRTEIRDTNKTLGSSLSLDAARCRTKRIARHFGTAGYILEAMELRARFIPPVSVLLAGLLIGFLLQNITILALVQNRMILLRVLITTGPLGRQRKTFHGSGQECE